MKKIYTILLAFIVYSAWAQQGQLDPLFSVPANLYGQNWGLAKDSNGKILVACTYGSSALTIKKLTSTGGIDPNFLMSNLNTSANFISKILVINNGKIVATTDATSCGANTVNHGIFKIDSSGNFEAFNPPFPSGFRATAVAKLSGGDLIVGGIYSTYVPSGPQIFRVNSTTGALVSGFTTGTLTRISNGVTGNGEIDDIIILPGDNIAIGGDFVTYNGTTKYDLVKINSSGVPQSFPMISFTNPLNRVWSMALNINNKLIVGGEFGINSGNGYAIFQIDLTTNTIDNSFSIPDTVGSTIYKLATQTDGKIVIGGQWQSIEGQPYMSISRLLSTGELDPCFDPGNGLGPSMYAPFVSDLILDNDNNIYISGLYYDYNGTPQNNFISKISGSTQLLAVDDTIFIPTNATTTSYLKVLLNDKINGKSISVGDVAITYATTNPTVTGITINYTTGTINIAPTTPPGVYTYTYTICPLNVTCGQCDTATATITVAEPQISASGDTSVYCQMAVPGEILSTTGFLWNDSYNSTQATLDNVDLTILSPLPTGLTHFIEGNGEGFHITSDLQPGTYNIQYKICDKFNSTNCKTASETLIILTRCENNHNMGQADNTVKVSGLQSTHKIVIAGDFSTYGSASKNKIARLKHEDLTLDTSFTATGPGSGQDILDFKILGNDYIIVGGNFMVFNGVQRNGITKLNPNGVTDTSFNSAAIASNPSTAGFKKNGGQATVYCVEVDHLGNILVGGDFTHYNNIAVKNIARLTPAGTLDISNFNPGTSFDGIPYNIVSLGSAGMLVGGSFTTYKGDVAKKIVKLDNSAGKMTGFNSTYLTGNYVEEIETFSGGIILAGSFTNYAGYTRNNFVVINQNGIINTNISPSFTGGAVKTVAAVYPDSYPFASTGGLSYINSFYGGVYVGGEFTAVNGNTAAHNLVFIKADGTINPNFNPGTGPDNSVYTITPEDNDYKIILGGSFQNYNSEWTGRITRIFPGNVDSFAPVGFNPSNTGQIQMREANTSDLIFENSISIYPNPSEGIFNIDFKGYDEQKFDITVHNTLGQLIYQGVVTPENTNQIDLTRFESGSYFISLVNNKETINKVVIKK